MSRRRSRRINLLSCASKVRPSRSASCRNASRVLVDTLMVVGRIILGSIPDGPSWVCVPRSHPPFDPEDSRWSSRSVSSTSRGPASLARTPRSHTNRLGIRQRRLPRRRDPCTPTPDPRAATPDRPPEIHRNRPNDPCPTEQHHGSHAPGDDVPDRPARNSASMAPTTRCTALDPTAHTKDGTPTDRPRTPASGHPPRQPESQLGVPAYPRGTRTARTQTRRVDRLEDPPRRRDRPDTRPDRPIVVRVHPFTVESRSRDRLRMCRHRAASPIPCSVRHRGRHSAGAFGRDHHHPDRLLDHPSRPQPDDEARRQSSVQIPDPRRCRTIHPILRRSPRRIRHNRNQNTAPVTSSQRIRRTVGAHSPSRTPRPHHHLERTPTPTAARRIPRALQQPSPAPRTPPTSTQRHRRRHPDRHRPTNPTSPNLRRTHQRVPNRSLSRFPVNQQPPKTPASTRQHTNRITESPNHFQVAGEDAG